MYLHKCIYSSERYLIDSNTITMRIIENTALISKKLTKKRLLTLA